MSPPDSRRTITIRNPSPMNSLALNLTSSDEASKHQVPNTDRSHFTKAKTKHILNTNGSNSRAFITLDLKDS